MAESDNDKQKLKALAEIDAFDLVTEALTNLDAYKRSYNVSKRSYDISHLNAAKIALNEALAKLREYGQEKTGDAGSLQFRARYFSTLIEYLNGSDSNELSNSFADLKKLIVDEMLSSEISYNTGAAYYSSKSYVNATQYFEEARHSEVATPEVRLLAGAGVALSKAKAASQLTNALFTTDREKAWEQAQEVKVLYRKLRWELFLNFLRRHWGARHVERELSRRANALIKQARREVSHISPPKQTVTVDKQPPTASID